MSVFSNRLKELIKERGLRYTEVAEKTGIKHYTLSAYANARVEPDIESLIILCKFFNVSSDYIVGLTDVKIPIHIENKLKELDKALDKHINSFKGALVNLIQQNKLHK